MQSEKEVIDDILYDYFHHILRLLERDNVPIIFEGQNGVRPKAPFLSISYNGITSLGTTPFWRVHHTYNEDGIVENTIQPIERNCTLRGFGKSTEEILNLIRDCSFFEKTSTLLDEKKVCLKHMDEVVEGSNNFLPDEEKFYYLDFIVSYNRVRQMEVNYIEELEISGTDEKGKEIVHTRL